MSRFAELIALLPVRFYLRCGIEEGEESSSKILTAVIMEEAPEGGWESPDQYFGSPGHAGGLERIAAWKFDDVARAGISVSPGDPEAFDRLSRSMLEHFLRGRKVLPEDPGQENCLSGD